MPRVNIEYILYDSNTDLPVCIGKIEECARFANTTPNVLKSAMYRYLSGERGAPRYQLFDLDRLIDGYYLEKEECHD